MYSTLPLAGWIQGQRCGCGAAADCSIFRHRPANGAAVGRLRGDPAGMSRLYLRYYNVVLTIRRFFSVISTWLQRSLYFVDFSPLYLRSSNIVVFT